MRSALTFAGECDRYLQLRRGVYVRGADGLGRRRFASLADGSGSVPRVRTTPQASFFPCPHERMTDIPSSVLCCRSSGSVGRPTTVSRRASATSRLGPLPSALSLSRPHTLSSFFHLLHLSSFRSLVTQDPLLLLLHAATARPSPLIPALRLSPSRLLPVALPSPSFSVLFASRFSLLFHEIGTHQLVCSPRNSLA